MKEFAASDFSQQPLCIVYPEIEGNFVLGVDLINLLPSFLGNTEGDPYMHLKEIIVVCFGMKPHSVTEDQICLRSFSFSLKERRGSDFTFCPLVLWPRGQR